MIWQEHIRIIKEQMDALEMDDDKHLLGNPAAWLMLQEAQDNMIECEEALRHGDKFK